MERRKRGKAEHMEAIVTAEEMKNLDQYTISEMGVPSCVLMERAALSAVTELNRGFLGPEERVLVVCGSGNNGGDGIAAARLLHLQGVRTEIFFAGSRERMTEETARQWRIAENYQVPFVMNPAWNEYTTIVDAMFGVGLSRPVEGARGEIIRCMNASPAKKAALDIPSGVDGDTGQELGIAFRADLTVTFAFRKRGLCLHPGREFAGRVAVTDIGIYRGRQTSVRAFSLGREDLHGLPARRAAGNKGTFGKVLVVAGSSGMCGAAFLCAAAAFGAGAGMVKIQTAEENRVPLQTLLPEAMLSVRFEEKENEKNLDWCDVLVIGPGLGTGKESGARAEWFLSRACATGKPVVLDADGLNLLCAHPEWRAYLSGRVILTPHLGEMARLTGRSAAEIRKSMAETALSYAKETGAVCVLKDACTVTADAEGQLFFNLSGNPGMATAGSGDVLSGVIAGVCCMYLDCPERDPGSGKKAALGVMLHGTAGDLAARKKGQRGMKAGDLADAVSEVLRRLEAEGGKKPSCRPHN